MKDATALVPRVGSALAGRPNANATRALNLARRRFAARWIRTTSSLFAYLEARLENARYGGLPLDSVWAKLYSDLADRVGARRGFEQQNLDTTITATVAPAFGEIANIDLAVATMVAAGYGKPRPIDVPFAESPEGVLDRHLDLVERRAIKPPGAEEEIPPAPDPGDNDEE